MVAEASQPNAVGGASFWLQLSQATDPASYRPKLREGVVSREFKTTQGEPYVIVNNPAAATYLRLMPEDFYVFQLMDGSHTVQDLVVAYMLKFRRFALQSILQLTQDLRANEFLVDRPYPTYPRLRQITRPHSVAGFFDRLFGFYLNREFPINGMDSVLERAYERGVWLLFTRPSLLLMALITVVGVPLLLWHLFTAHIPLGLGVSLDTGLPLLYASLFVIALSHELGHAFTVKASGRRVRRGGLCIFYGFPAVFVDTQDIWMEGRAARIGASWAGPYTGFLLAGLAGVLISLAPAASWVPFVRVFGVVALVENAFQLMPLIQLDGYYILMDWLDIPNLRTRALTFIRHDLWHKLRHREHFSRDERIFTIFGLLAAFYTIYAISLAVTFYWAHARSAVEKALRVPNLGSLLALVFFLVLIIPFMIGMVLRLTRSAQAAARSLARATGAARDRWYRERLTLLAQVPALSSLGPEPLRALAPHLKDERRPTGSAIVRQGEQGDRFYLIVDGQAEAFVDSGDGPKLVATLGPMDYFGERALIEDAPRAATVRAKTRLRLLTLRARDFHASVQPYIAADAALHRRLGELAEIDRFPLLAPLKERERELLLRRLVPETYQSGETILRQGERGDRFYLLRSGSVEVVRAGQDGEASVIETLRAGDFFGEIALLLDTARVATVRAVEATQVWALSRHDFADLLSGYFSLDRQLTPVLHERLSEDNLLLVDGDALPALETGTPAPDVAFTTATGEAVALSQYFGRSLLLWFSPGPSDRSTLAEALHSIAAVSAEQGLQIVRVLPSAPGASEDPAPSAPDGPDPSLPVLYDPEMRSFRLYGMYEPAASASTPADEDWQRAFAPSSGDERVQRPAPLSEGFALIGRDGALRSVERGADAPTALREALDDLLGVTAP